MRRIVGIIDRNSQVGYDVGMGSLLLMISFLLQVPSAEEIHDTTLCELREHPEVYAGKLVRLRARISGSQEMYTLEHPFTVRDVSCSTALYIVMELPKSVRPKPNFSLERTPTFDQFTDVTKKHSGLYVQAIVEGRFDVVFKWQDRKRVRIGEGNAFGKKGLGDARLVLKRLTEVETQPLPPRK